MHFLENDILRLRAPEPEDVVFLYDWENNTDVWCIGDTIAPYSRDILKQYIETAHLDIFETRQLRFMIDLKKDNKTIGTIDLYDFNPQHSRAGIGILIADDKERQKGFASGALQLLIQYSFGILGLHQVFCHIQPSNTNSIHLFEKHGFIYAGCRRQWIRKASGWEDENIYQLINPE